MSNGQEVSLEEVAAMVADQFARRIGREVRQQLETLQHDVQQISALPITADVSEPKAVTLSEAARLLSVSVGALRKFIAKSVSVRLTLVVGS